MELWQLNAYVNGLNKERKAKSREQFAIAHTTAALTGAAFAGKLKKLDHYLEKDEDEDKKSRQNSARDEISDYDIAKLDEAAKRHREAKRAAKEANG